MANYFDGSFLDLWLNTTFLEDAFSYEELKMIAPLNFDAERNKYDRDRYSYIGQCHGDYVFKTRPCLFSDFKEYNQAFKEPTAFAVSLGLEICEYWLYDCFNMYDYDPAYEGLWVRTNSGDGYKDVDKWSGVVPTIALKSIESLIK
jgi:hypothetical protein